jgi:hypothetical protein
VAELKRILRISSLTLDEINRLLGFIGEQIDTLEGLRGNPNIRSAATFTGAVKIRAGDDEDTILHGMGDV